MAKHVINAFNGGEVSPDVYARYDSPIYNTACIKMENFIPQTYGGAERRPGTQFLDQLSNNKRVMYPFVFNNNNTYNLIFSANVLEIYSTYVDSESVGNEFISSLGTNFLEEELYELKFIQSADIVFITHPNHPVQKLSRISNTAFTLTNLEFKFPPLLNEESTTLAVTDTTLSSTAGVFEPDHKTIGSSVLLTSSESMFTPSYINSQFLIKQIRDKQNSCFTKTITYDNSSDPKVLGFTTDGINASFSNWSFETRGTNWKGSVTILRSLNGGDSYEEYVQIGESLAASQNFTFSSTEPEPFNSLLKIRASLTVGTIDVELTMADPYAYGLVTIDSTTGTDESPSNTATAVVNSPLLYSTSSFNKLWVGSGSNLAKGDFVKVVSGRVTTKESNLSHCAITGVSGSSGTTTATLTRTDGSGGAVAHGLTTNDTITVTVVSGQDTSDATYVGTFKIDSTPSVSTLTFTLPEIPTTNNPTNLEVGKQRLVQLTTALDGAGTALSHIKDVTQVTIGGTKYILALRQKGITANYINSSTHTVSDTAITVHFYQITNTGATNLSFTDKGYIDLYDGGDTNFSTALGIEHYDNKVYIAFAARTDSSPSYKIRGSSFSESVFVKKFSLTADITEPNLILDETYNPSSIGKSQNFQMQLFANLTTDTLSGRTTTGLGLGFDGSNYYFQLGYMRTTSLRWGSSISYQTARFYPSSQSWRFLHTEAKRNGAHSHNYGGTKIRSVILGFARAGWDNGSTYTPRHSKVTQPRYSVFKGLHKYVDTKILSGSVLQVLDNTNKNLSTRKGTDDFDLVTSESNFPLPNQDWAGMTYDSTTGQTICVSTTGRFIEVVGQGTEKFYQKLDASNNEATFTADFNLGKYQELDPFNFNFQEGAFSDRLGYPHSVSIFENRLCFGGTDTKPNTLWLSKTNDLDNFQVGPIANDSMRLTINSNTIDEIEWLCSSNKLVIGTSSNEWTLGAGSDQLAITPTQLNLSRKSGYGSKDMQAILVNASILFFMREGKSLREWISQGNQDNFLATNLTSLANHLTIGGISQMSVQTQPETCVWMVRNDGVLIGLTYEKENKVFAWHQHTFKDATVESVSVLPSINSEDNIFLILKRSNDRVYVKFDYRYWGSAYETEYNGLDQHIKYTDFTGSKLGEHVITNAGGDVNNNYVTLTFSENHNLEIGNGIVVGGLTSLDKTTPADEVNGQFSVDEIVDSKSIRYLIEITVAEPYDVTSATCTDNKLTHLANMPVTYKCDGIAKTGTVDSTLYTLDVGSQSNKTIYVGLPYTSILAPLYTGMEFTGGTTRGSRISVSTALVRFKDTLSAKVGQTETDLDNVKFKSNTELNSEDAPCYLSNANEYLQTLYVVQEEPQPCTVLGMIVDIEGGK